jgi:hypothetical protein
MNILRVVSARHGKDDEIQFELEIDTGSFGKEIVPNCYRANDPFAGDDEKYLSDWIVENEGLIEPYVSPPAPTLQEIRAQMPALTSRQFWMAAANIGTSGTDKDVIIAAIKAEMADSVDRKMMIAELESSTFERVNPTIVKVLALMQIPAEQVDDLWVWAAGL